MVAQGLEIIDRNARIQTELIADLLDLSRIVSGNARVDMVPVDLVFVLSQVIQSIRPAALERRLDLKIFIKEDAGGLGLAICKHFTVLHGGEIYAASEGLGRGASFTVKLPLIVDAIVRSSSEESESPVPFTSGDQLVSDNRFFGMMVCYLRFPGPILQRGELARAALCAFIAEQPGLDLALTGDHHWRPDGGLRNRKLRPLRSQPLPTGLHA